MDKTLADNAQDVDNENEAGQAIQDCLRNSLIVREILKHFSSEDLLRISLVNKLWKFEARSLVNQRGNLIANLKSRQFHGVTCETTAFVSDLPKLSAAPFSGILFDINYHYDGHNVCSSTHEDLLAIQTVDQLSLKNVSVKMTGPWKKFRKCSAFLLAKKVLRHFCEGLEELELGVWVRQGDYIKQVIKDCSFPRLQTLKVAGYDFRDQNESYMEALLSRAPNLKLLHCNWKSNSALRFLQGTSVEFVYTSPILAPFDAVSDDFMNAFRFECIKFEYTGRRFNFERFNRIAPILLQASRSTIRSMYVDAVLAVPLMCYGTRLENVKILQMDIDCDRMESIEPRILNIVKNFDFKRIFPNLDKVNVVRCKDYSDGLQPELINAFIERANAVLTEPLLDRTARIKKLSLAHLYPFSVAAPFFLDMFPNIEKLEVIVDGLTRPTPFGYIWKCLDLNELKFQGNMLPTTTGNLDGVFCGIFPEEVAELKLMDDEYLKRVNIVPVMPAITCLRNLRTINLHHKCYSQHPIVDDDATFIFSKVTTLLAFAKQPALVVNLRISARTALLAMTHLEPYVSITFDVL